MEELTIESWDKFNQIADHLNMGDLTKYAYVFRGHSNSDWLLQPTLFRSFRENDISEERALELEKSALKEFESQALLHLTPNELSSTIDTISWWTVMQQHGAPTRLLDWTSSIYAAAYFAVSDNFKKDGSVWLVHVSSVKSKMTKLYGDEASFSKTNESTMKSQFLRPGTAKVLLFGVRARKSARMVAQQGNFSICKNVLGDHGDILSEVFHENQSKELYSKLIIPYKMKKPFLKKLRAMNVTASSLFPGLDGLGKSVQELIDAATN